MEVSEGGRGEGLGCKRSAAALPHLLNKGLLVFRSQVGGGRGKGIGFEV